MSDADNGTVDSVIVTLRMNGFKVAGTTNGAWWIIRCARCESAWKLRKVREREFFRVHRANVLDLLNHAAAHDAARVEVK